MVGLKKVFEQVDVDLRNALSGDLQVIVHKFHAFLGLLVLEPVADGSIGLRKRSQQD